MAVQVPQFLEHLKAHPHITQDKSYLEPIAGLPFNPSVTGRLRTGQRCMGLHLRQWKNSWQYLRYVLAAFLLLYH
jgi:hypothetical protein